MSLHPYFDFDVSRNITARVGQTAFLRCKVEQLGDKSVCTYLLYVLLYLIIAFLIYISSIKKTPGITNSITHLYENYYQILYRHGNFQDKHN